MDRSAIVLAGRFSSRFEQDISVLELKGEPLLQHVVDAVNVIVDEVLVIADSQERSDEYLEILGSHVKFIVANSAEQGSLAGALAGFEAATQKYALLLSSGAPFVSQEIMELLFDLCPGKSAVIPRWPNGEIEALHAVYRVDAVLQAARQAFSEGCSDLVDVVEKLRGVRYVSTLVVQELDPDLKTLFKVNSPVELKRAEVLANPRRTKK